MIMMLPEKLETPLDIARFLRTMDNSEDAECGFDMLRLTASTNTEHACGTACCIAGWVYIANTGDFSPDLMQWEWVVIDEIAKVLGDRQAANAICFPPIMFGETADMTGVPEELARKNDAETYFMGATPQQAARVIENYVETGQVKWLQAMREG
jgi:hypothetical protein